MDSTYPAKLHISKFARELLNEVRSAAPNVGKHVVVLQGAHTLCRDDTDRELPFHQEANFHYLTGCLVPSSVLILTIDPGSAPTAKLFVPPYDADAAMWSVPPPAIETICSSATTTCDSDKLDFELAELGYVGQDEGYLSSVLKGEDGAMLHLLSEDLRDPLYPAPPAYLSSMASKATAKYLRTALHRSRLTKTPLEIEYIRQANRITSEAHEVVMRELGRFARARGGFSAESQVNGKKGGTVAGPGEWEIKSEADAEAVFVACCRRHGAGQAYLPIVASGKRASTLHYVCNDRLFPVTTKSSSQQPSTFPTTHDHPPTATGRGCCGTVPNDLPSDLSNLAGPFAPQVLLIDAGCEVRGGYASDVTRTIPVGNGGKFTEEGRVIYELVLKMQKAAEAMLKPGVHWDNLHFECHRILCEEFLRLGVFKGASSAEILKLGLTAAFLPHGLGHSLGLDVHDSLQLLRSEHLDIPQNSLDHPSLFRYLRIRRPVQEGFVLTTEPGCYFSPELMDSVGIRQSEFVDTEVLDKYVPVGGVRIENVVVVTKGGCEILTRVGRDVEWVEGVCSGEL